MPERRHSSERRSWRPRRKIQITIFFSAIGLALALGGLVWQLGAAWGAHTAVFERMKDDIRELQSAHDRNHPDDAPLVGQQKKESK